MATQAIIALGSNVDPVRNLPAGLDRLRAAPEIHVVRTSRVYASPAVGPPGQPDFHNAVAIIETELGPLALREALRVIEAESGRRRTLDRFAPRPLDLDIVAYGSVVVLTRDIEIPDPETLLLAHLCVPLAELIPDWRPPGSLLSAQEAARHHELVPVE